MLVSENGMKCVLISAFSWVYLDPVVVGMAHLRKGGAGSKKNLCKDSKRREPQLPVLDVTRWFWVEK